MSYFLAFVRCIINLYYIVKHVHKLGNIFFAY